MSRDLKSMTQSSQRGSMNTGGGPKSLRDADQTPGLTTTATTERRFEIACQNGGTRGQVGHFQVSVSRTVVSEQWLTNSITTAHCTCSHAPGLLNLWRPTPGTTLLSLRAAAEEYWSR